MASDVISRKMGPPSIPSIRGITVQIMNRFLRRSMGRRYETAATAWRRSAGVRFLLYYAVMPRSLRERLRKTPKLFGKAIRAIRIAFFNGWRHAGMASQQA